MKQFVLVASAVILAASLGSAVRAADKPITHVHGDPHVGKYLVTVVGCSDCHTPGTFYGAPKMNKFLSGSELGWVGPWGVVHAANLTPDKETGLGNWTDEQIVTAIRTGVRPDGRQLAPIMPWMDLSHLTDKDAYSIAAYLKTLPAVKHAVPKIQGPTEKPAGALINFPPPPAWDAPEGPPPGGAAPKKK